VRPLVPPPDEPVRPTLVPGVVAFPVLSEVSPPAENDVAEEVFDQEALAAVDGLDDDPRHVQDATVDADDSATPALPLRLADEPAARDEDDAPQLDETRERTSPLPRLKNLGVANRDEKAAPARKHPQRPHVPAWDDIMLGVRRTTD
jgi:hypothetical protein